MGTVLKSSNRGGVPCLKSVSAVVVDTTLTVTFPAYSNYPRGFSGLMALNIAQPFTATGVTSVVLVIQGTSVQLMANASTAAEAAQVPGAGVYLVFVDQGTHTIQLV